MHNVQVEKIYRKSKLWLLPLALRGLLASAFLLKVHFQFASKQTARDSQKNQLEVELHFPLFCLLPSGDAFFYDHKSFKKKHKKPHKQTYEVIYKSGSHIYSKSVKENVSINTLFLSYTVKLHKFSTVQSL